MSPRGVRFFVGKPGPARPASRTDEKKGKSGSIHSAQGIPAGCCLGAPPATSPHISVATAIASVSGRNLISVIL